MASGKLAVWHAPKEPLLLLGNQLAKFAQEGNIMLQEIHFRALDARLDPTLLF